MKNKLLITTALASSLVAGSALAQTAITGSLTASYKSVQGKNNSGNGNSFGKESQINVSNKGKLNIGGLSYAAGFSLEFDGADGIYSYKAEPTLTTTTGTGTLVSSAAAAASLGVIQSVSVASSTRQTGTSAWHLENNYIDIISESSGTTLTISSDHIQNGRGGLAHIVGQHAEDFTGGVARTTTGYAMDYAGTAVAESFGVGIVQNVGKLGKLSALYVPNHQASINVNRDTGTTAANSAQSGGVVADDGDAILGSDRRPNAYEIGFIGDLGVKGLTVKAFMNREGTKSSDTDGTANLSKTKGQTVGVRYSFDAFTVGVNQMKEKLATATVATTDTNQMEYGLGYAVNKDLSIGLYHNRAKRSNVVESATQSNTEKTTSIALGYSLGPVALSAQYGKVYDMGGEKASDADVMFIALTTAF
jgi:hypothetical protein